MTSTESRTAIFAPADPVPRLHILNKIRRNRDHWICRIRTTLSASEPRIRCFSPLCPRVVQDNPSDKRPFWVQFILKVTGNIRQYIHKTA
ncbi:hypothetical protein SAMN05443144_10613 [Fodinibius roseus]|uniref:Uncharacterized protein n=1 Tax=Fodinibius roseus TaxID=1194090 RepID=A0A1M4ZEY5_9BACT|nr:hypothetical protein SAMN05443144_10613 [Fodinibius roseus]